MGDDSTSEPSLRVGRVLHGTTAEGPGRRTAVWVQGCSIRCSGCINPHLFTRDGGHPTPPAQIVEAAIAANVEGLTILGGEPFDQPFATASLARKAASAGLGVVCFTGYTIESLQSRGFENLLEHIDLLVDGPFIAALPDTERALVGSTNQRFIHLSERYTDYRPERVGNRLELRIQPSGQTDVAGFLSGGDLDLLAGLLGARRVFGRHLRSRTTRGS